MSTYTIKLSKLVEAQFELGLTHLDYPIFDENYRDSLNDKIIKHYWNYEIGQETESMFRFSLNRKMNEIMPYYNQLYVSKQIEFDPLQTVNYTDFTSSTNDITGNKTDSNTNTATANSLARNVNSDTPQVLLSPDEDYASSAVNTAAQNTSGSTAEATNTHTDNIVGEVDRTVKGSQGIASDLLMRYRASFLNIDMDVIKELETLFMLIWDNGDEFTKGIGVGYGIPNGYFPII